MSKFVFTHTIENKKIEHSVEEELLYDVIISFEEFLRGCGFRFEGNLQIVKDNQYKEDTLFCDEFDDFDDTDVWAWTVDQLDRIETNKAEKVNMPVKCSVCKIDERIMKDHKCYDANCGLGMNKNAN